MHTLNVGTLKGTHRVGVPCDLFSSALRSLAVKTSDLLARIPAQAVVLDVGCGRDKVRGAMGIDCAESALADIRHDLNIYPWPLAESSMDAVVMRNFIEHAQDVVRLMEEVHRILRPGGHVLITTPHFSSVYSYQDPTHRWHFAFDSLEYFTSDTKHSNFYSSRRFTIEARGMDFGKSFPFSQVAKFLFGLSPRKYEKHFAWIFPANSMWFHLRAVKPNSGNAVAVTRASTSAGC